MHKRWHLSDIERLFENEHSYLGGDLALDMFEKGDDLIILMNLAGIDPDKIDISLEDHHLRISGQRDDEEESTHKDYYYKEIKRGSFERVISLPLEVDITKTFADVKHGILRVKLPKKQPSKSGKVKIAVNK